MCVYMCTHTYRERYRVKNMLKINNNKNIECHIPQNATMQQLHEHSMMPIQQY